MVPQSIGFGNAKGREVCAFLENIGFGELVIIFVVALVLFGPSKLPELGKSLGQGIREFKKATQAISEEVTKAASEEVASATKTPAPVQSEQTPKA